MREDMPPWRQYWPVLERLGDGYRPDGLAFKFRCPFPNGHNNKDANPSAFVKIGDRGQLIAHCNGCGATWDRFFAHAGLPTAAWFPGGGNRMTQKANSKPVARYEYRDRTGKVVAVKVRWEPGFSPGKDKEFSWERPVTDPEIRDLLAAGGVPRETEVWAKGGGCIHSGDFHAGLESGKWILRSALSQKCQAGGPGVLLHDAGVGLYRLPDMLKETKRAVWTTEGEGKADLLASLGFCAVSGPDGKGKWKIDWGSDFKGRHVVVIPDRDTVQAEEWGLKVGTSAMYYGARSVTLVLIPLDELPGGKQSDIKDWLRKKFPGKASDIEKAAAVRELAKRCGQEWRQVAKPAGAA